MITNKADDPFGSSAFIVTKQKRQVFRPVLGLSLVELDRTLDLIGTEASGTSVHMAGSTVNDSLDALDVGLPCTVGTSVGVGNLDTEGHALAAKITLSHFIAPPIWNHLHAPLKALRYDSRLYEKKQAFFCKFFCFFIFWLIFRRHTGIMNEKDTKTRWISMIETYSVPLSTLVSEFKLQVAYASDDYSTKRLTVEDLARPGLPLAGFFDYVDPMRLQIMGNAEFSYLAKLPYDERKQIFDRLFSYKFPALIIARGHRPSDECLAMAHKHNISILLSPERTSALTSAIITYLRAALAPRISRHGVLMEIYGEGVLITGDSGIGKSETAIELLKRGHRLIADDAVEIKKVSNRSVVGTAPELIRNYIELRGIGIINVAKLFGIGAVKLDHEINLVVNIVPWNTSEVYDRLGLEDHFTDILDVQIPINTIPITPGRNLAVILEVAAMNNRQRRMGYNAAQEFTEEINRHFSENTGNI